MRNFTMGCNCHKEIQQNCFQNCLPDMAQLRKTLVPQLQNFCNSFDGNYFTSSDPHHDMLGGGCQVRVVIKNMMGRMENLRTLISGFLGLVILVRWALVTMFLS